MASLKDISAATGYSIRTVSRVLSDSGYASETARKRIKAAAKQLGYKPNLAARALRTNTSYEVVVVPASLDELHMSKIAGIADVLTPAGYSIVMLFPADYKNTDALLDAVMNKSPAGVIFASFYSKNNNISKKLKTTTIPSVFIDSNQKGINSIEIDRQHGVYEAVNYLYGLGKRRIAYLGPEDYNRLDGYRRAINEHCLSEIVFATKPASTNNFTDIQQVIKKLFPDILKAQPQAIQCYSDAFAIALMAVLHERNIVMPDKMAVVGFDDRNFAQMVYPSLTTVAQPSHQLGKAAAKMLLSLIADPSQKPLKEVLPTRLIIRNSA